MVLECRLALERMVEVEVADCSKTTTNPNRYKFENRSTSPYNRNRLDIDDYEFAAHCRMVTKNEIFFMSDR